MIFEISKNANPNYLAKVITISNLRKHHNADRLQITTIDGNNVIVDMQTKIGDIVVYFPVESCIEDWFLKKYNQYRDKNLNADPTAPCGFFEENRRVKAIRLRDEASCGVVFPIDKFIDASVNPDKYINTEFDTINGVLICTKYIPKYLKTPPTGNKVGNKRSKNIKNLSKVIDTQFRFHIDTVQFGKNIHKFMLDDVISITLKLDGTSSVYSRVLCKKNLSTYQKILKFFGANIPDIDYDYLYASRSVIKNKNMNPTVGSGFYNADVWKIHFDKVKDFLDKGMTYYGEIVGYVDGTSKAIQCRAGIPFDYGCPVGTSEFYIYRITYTNPDGKVYEFSARQVQEYCQTMGLKVVPEIFYGKFRDILSPELVKEKEFLENPNNIDYVDVVDQDGNICGKDLEPSYKERKNAWETNVLDYLRDKYLEIEDPLCKSHAPLEGVVFRREKNYIDSYKFKSFKFLQLETKSNDKGEVDIETQESISDSEDSE